MGVIPGGYGTIRLSRLAGKGMAKYLIFTGEHISAGEAHRMGIVERVVSASDLMPTALALAQKIAAKSPLVLAMAKKAIDEGAECDFDRAGEYEFAMALISSSTEDRLEGTNAFLEKRKPRFKGR
jgi:enoyl-CoA hydratase